MKTKFTKKELIEDEYLIARHKQLSELETEHEEALARIKREKKLLEKRKMELMDFGG